MALRDGMLVVCKKGFLNLEIEGMWHPDPGGPLTTRQPAEYS